MEFHHRKILLVPKSISIYISSSDCSNDDDKCETPPKFSFPPPKQTPKHHVSSILILMLCVLGAAFLYLCYLTFFKKYRANPNNSGVRNRNQPQFEDAHEDFIDENHGPILDNPIWYIHTIGLQQSIIDSIAVFKYKKDEVLIEGTDCSVCLNEFQEDETLRLLPKCSHAFHIPCIDTWLRSHKNCPLCRAPIVCESNNDPGSVSEPNSNDLGPREENLENHRVGEDGTSEISDGDEVLGEFSTEEEMNSKILDKNLRHLNAKNSGLRVFSDLGDHHRLKVEEELEPKRRSISMDSSSASMIYLAIANNLSKENEGSSSTKPVQVNKSDSEMVGKRLNRNSSLYRLVKSSSFGRSFQKRPVSMKRSFSTTGKQFFSGSQVDSYLPL